MRNLIVLLAFMVALAPDAAAQQRARTAGTMWGAVGVYNDAGTTRVSGPLDVPATREITGNVAVLNGPVVVAGHITGSLVAINADVRLKPGARIGGDVLIVGGVLVRDDSTTVDGEVRTQAELLRYTLEGERLVPEEDRTGDWRPRMRPPMRDRGDSYTDLFFVAARTYNRVEGLPVLVGPRFRRPTDWGRIEVEALGVVRTAEPIRWDRNTLGHDARFDLRLGVRNGLVLSGRAFDVIAPVESWQLTDQEAGLATFALHRDFRDHYGRHGWEAALGGRLGEEASLSFVAGSEQWRAVDARRPFTLREDGKPWRINAPMDQGRVDLASVRLKIDTRERVRAPWLGGWYFNADVERGSGTITRNIGQGPVMPPLAPEQVTYTRGFIDARRYNRVSPGTELNFRLVAGGSIGGDRLPLQRRLSLGGPGAMEGYDFRRNWYDASDVFTCGGIDLGVGRPALCDRIALGQVELRQSIDFDFHDNDWWRFRDLTPAWVLFADVGRGWTTPQSGDPYSHGKGLPPLSTFRTSLGAGLDLGEIGFYFAKSVSTPDETLNFLVRLGRRF